MYIVSLTKAVQHFRGQWAVLGKSKLPSHFFFLTIVNILMEAMFSETIFDVDVLLLNDR